MIFRQEFLPNEAQNFLFDHFAHFPEVLKFFGFVAFKYGRIGTRKVYVPLEALGGGDLIPHGIANGDQVV